MSTMISLEKKLNISLEKAGIINIPKMEVKALVDKSGSMHSEFASGWVQSTLDLFLAAALKFDDDGSLQVGFFNTSFTQEHDMTAADAGVYVKKHGISPYGGTCFAGGVKAFKSGTAAPKQEKKAGFFGSLFGSNKPTQQVVEATKPTYLAMVTDGENNDKPDFENELSTMTNTFFQIIAIGDGVDKRYLDRVASTYENVAVMYLPNPNSVTEEQFYDMMLNNEFKKFINV